MMEAKQTIKTAIKTVERWLAAAVDTLVAPISQPVLVPVPVRSHRPPRSPRRQA